MAVVTNSLLTLQKAQAAASVAAYNNVYLPKIKRIHASYGGTYSFPVLNPLLPVQYQLKPIPVSGISDTNFIRFLSWMEYYIPFLIKDKWFVFDGTKWNINFFGNSGQMDHFTIPFVEYGIVVGSDVVPYSYLDVTDYNMLTALMLMKPVFVPINPPNVIATLQGLTQNPSGQDVSDRNFFTAIQLTVAIVGAVATAVTIYSALATPALSVQASTATPVLATTPVSAVPVSNDVVDIANVSFSGSGTLSSSVQAGSVAGSIAENAPLTTTGVGTIAGDVTAGSLAGSIGGDVTGSALDTLNTASLAAPITDPQPLAFIPLDGGNSLLQNAIDIATSAPVIAEAKKLLTKGNAAPAQPVLAPSILSGNVFFFVGLGILGYFALKN